MKKLIAFFRQHYFTDTSPETKQLRKVVYNVTTLQPANISLYQLALQHSSASKELNANERLELLGDAVLSLIIAEYLYKKYPLQPEGFLTEIRSRIVNRASLNELAQKIGIDKLLQYDTRLMDKHGLKVAYGNALEAFIGAVYLDQGYERCRRFVIDRLLHIYVDLEAIVLTDNNYKSKILAWAQKNRKKTRFELVNEKCVNGQKEFITQLLIEDEVSGKGWGKSKKEAEQMAAQDAWEKLS